MTTTKAVIEMMQSRNAYTVQRDSVYDETTETPNPKYIAYAQHGHHGRRRFRLHVAIRPYLGGSPRSSFALAGCLSLVSACLCGVFLYFVCLLSAFCLSYFPILPIPRRRGPMASWPHSCFRGWLPTSRSCRCFL